MSRPRRSATRPGTYEEPLDDLMDSSDSDFEYESVSPGRPHKRFRARSPDATRHTRSARNRRSNRVGTEVRYCPESDSEFETVASEIEAGRGSRNRKRKVMDEVEEETIEEGTTDDVEIEREIAEAASSGNSGVKNTAQDKAGRGRAREAQNGAAGNQGDAAAHSQPQKATARAPALAPAEQEVGNSGEHVRKKSRKDSPKRSRFGPNREIVDGPQPKVNRNNCKENEIPAQEQD